MSDPNDGADRVIRAMTDENTFRVVAARTTATVQGVIDAQGATGAEAAQLAELATAAVLYRETMAPTLRVQAILRGGEQSGTMIADSNPDGTVRALRQGASRGPLRLDAPGALIELARAMPRGELHRGTVEVPADGTISAAMMASLEQSEQVLSMISVGAVLADDGKTVLAAGGYLVQLLPEVRDAEGVLMVMGERVKDFVDIRERLAETQASPEHLVEELLYAMPFTYLERSGVRFGCHCSHARVLAGLGTLGRDDLNELVAAEETLDIRCEYCGTDYRIAPEELRGLLVPS